VFDTKSRRALLRWMAKDSKRRTRAAVARALGVSQPAVSLWALCRARPETSRRAALEILTEGEVSADGWALPEERRHVADARPFRPTGTEG
jgi:hypothetical protein